MNKKAADRLLKFFSSEARLREIKAVPIRNIVRDIVKKSRNYNGCITVSQYNTLVKAKTWIYRHRKSMGVYSKPAKVKVFTQEEIEQYQKSIT